MRETKTLGKGTEKWCGQPSPPLPSLPSSHLPSNSLFPPFLAQGERGTDTLFSPIPISIPIVHVRAQLEHWDYKLLKSPLISGQLVKRHLALISVLAYKATIGLCCARHPACLLFPPLTAQ